MGQIAAILNLILLNYKTVKVLLLSKICFTSKYIKDVHITVVVENIRFNTPFKHLCDHFIGQVAAILKLRLHNHKIVFSLVLLKACFTSENTKTYNILCNNRESKQ